MDLADLSALLGEALPSASNEGMWVVLPGDYGADLAGSGAAALLGETRRMADGMGCLVHAVVEHSPAPEEAIAFGADRVIVTGDLAACLGEQKPEFVFLPAGCEAPAARLAQHWAAGLVTGVARGLRIDPESRALLAAHPVYGGEYELGCRVTSAVKIATVETGSLPPPVRDASRTGEIQTHEAAAADSRVRDLGPAVFTPPDWRPLSKARLIVAAGRGLRDSEGMALAAELARVLGAELAGDRSARDSGWLDAAHEVGVTAQEVAPELYVALGVLGDTVHNAAIVGARRVVAVHTNPKAPIFAVADVAVAGDPKGIVRQLLERLLGPARSEPLRV
jgi:electron transfer flavoprotein alpha subunit